jgi:flagellar basal body-associated protein FliL
MSKRMLIMVLTVVLLVAAGALVYINSTSKTLASAADCEDKPKPKNEFAMAAECDTPGAPATKGSTPATPAAGPGDR